VIGAQRQLEHGIMVRRRISTNSRLHGRVLRQQLAWFTSLASNTPNPPNFFRLGVRAIGDGHLAGGPNRQRAREIRKPVRLVDLADVADGGLAVAAEIREAL
jgi:hypothetical protein